MLLAAFVLEQGLSSWRCVFACASATLLRVLAGPSALCSLITSACFYDQLYLCLTRQINLASHSLATSSPYHPHRPPSAGGSAVAANTALPQSTSATPAADAPSEPA